MEIKGRVVANLGVQKGTSKAGKNWAKATVVVEYGDKYPKKIALDNMKNAESFGALEVGTEGTFHIDVESREFNGRWYTSVNCYKWETAQQASAQQVQQSVYQQAQPQAPATTTAPQADDLPF